MNIRFLFIACMLAAFIFCTGPLSAQKKPTVCILGGTPSTKDVLALIPDSIKSGYNFVSFNRPGFGGTKNEKMRAALLYKLARKAGLKKNDFGIIGISGGGPFAILLASKFKLKHCGIISGAVSKEAFFKYADKAVTKDIMESALKGYKDFEAAAMRFPNLDVIVKQAGASSTQVALRACYDEFNFIMADSLYAGIRDKSFTIDWWHGEEDVNIPLQSVELFLEKYPNAHLHKIAKATHGLDANVYMSKILKTWK